MKKAIERVIMTSVATVVLCLTLVFGLHFLGDKGTSQQHTVQTNQIHVTVNDSNHAKVERVKMHYIYYFRIYKGWIQRRKWNATTGAWVDPCWYSVKRANY